MLSRSIRTFLGILLIAITAVVAGCDSPEPIRTYSIPTEVPPQLQPDRPRMLAAMVPIGDQVWYYKILGPDSAVDTVADAFQDFVANLSYDEGEPVLSELPSRWTLAGEKPMRFASVDINTDQKQLDLSISKLTAGEDWDDYVAMNVNRWRGQVGLPKSTDRWAGGERFDVSAAERPGVWVDITGDADAAPTSMMPPMMSRSATSRPVPAGSDSRDPHAGLPTETRERIARGERPSVAPGPVDTPSASRPASDLDYERPEGWRDGRMSMMRKAAFEVGDDDPPTEITVMPAGGDLRANVARWLGQALDRAPTEDEVDAAMENSQAIEVSGRPAQRYVLTDTDDQTDQAKAIDATVVPMDGDISMFIKMTGSKSTVTDQHDEMSSFLESLSF